jgi:hypothetical protein
VVSIDENGLGDDLYNGKTKESLYDKNEHVLNTPIFIKISDDPV